MKPLTDLTGLLTALYIAVNLYLPTISSSAVLIRKSINYPNTDSRFASNKRVEYGSFQLIDERSPLLKRFTREEPLFDKVKSADNDSPIGNVMTQESNELIDDNDNADNKFAKKNRRYKRALQLLTSLLGSSSGGGGAGNGGASADSGEGGGGSNLGSLISLIGPLLSSSSGGGGGDRSESDESGQDGGGGGLGSLLGLIGPLISSSSGGGGNNSGDSESGGGGGSDLSSILSLSTGLSNSGNGQKKRELSNKQNF